MVRHTVRVPYLPSLISSRGSFLFSTRYARTELLKTLRRQHIGDSARRATKRRRRRVASRTTVNIVLTRSPSLDRQTTAGQPLSEAKNCVSAHARTRTDP